MLMEEANRKKEKIDGASFLRKREEVRCSAQMHLSLLGGVVSSPLRLGERRKGGCEAPGLM